MTDRHAMHYLTADECTGAGHQPCAVYGGKVYSFFRGGSCVVVVHGSAEYGRALDDVRERHLERAAMLAGERGA